MSILWLIGGVAFISVAVATLLAIFHARGSANASQKKPNNTWLSQKLQAEKLQSDIIINSIEDGVIVIDDQNTIRLFNPSAARLSGWQQAEATGLSYGVVLHFVDNKNKEYTAQNNPFARVLMEGRALHDNTISLVSRSNKTIAVNLSVSPLFDQNKRVTGAVGIFRDVSEERKEERQRAEFISTASHEMRTPVAAIEGYLALAMNDKVSTIDTRAREYLKKAHDSTQHLGQLFQDLLTSAKAEDGRLSNHPVPTEMSGYLEHLVEDLRFAAQKKNLEMEYVVGTSGVGISADDMGHKRVIQPLYYAMVDPERLREVIINLFDNAVKYTMAGKVSLGITGDDKVVQVYIRDTGSGIAPEDVPHLFEKFYRVDSTATRTIGGTGLGLFISRKIIEMYNGRIWVESILGKGSTFYINLPRLTNEQLKQGAPTPIIRPTTDTTSEA
jgi:PAS domain S-box-containing protein